MTDILSIPTPTPGDPIRASHIRAILEQVQRNSATSGRLATARTLARLAYVEIKAFDTVERTLTCVPVGLIEPEYTVHPPVTFTEDSRGGITYTYTDTNNRTADGAETQQLTPLYVIGDPIGIFFDGTAWRDLNVDGRQWARTVT